MQIGDSFYGGIADLGMFPNNEVRSRFVSGERIWVAIALDPESPHLKRTQWVMLLAAQPAPMWLRVPKYLGSELDNVIGDKTAKAYLNADKTSYTVVDCHDPTAEDKLGIERAIQERICDGRVRAPPIPLMVCVRIQKCDGIPVESFQVRI